MSDQAWDFVRYFNAVASLMVFGLIVAGVTARWDKTALRLRRIVPWVALTYGISAYGSLEIVRSDTFVSPGLRVALFAINLVGLLVSIAVGFSDHDYEMPTRRWQFFADNKK